MSAERHSSKPYFSILPIDPVHKECIVIAELVLPILHLLQNLPLEYDGHDGYNIVRVLNLNVKQQILQSIFTRKIQTLQSFLRVELQILQILKHHFRD